MTDKIIDLQQKIEQARQQKAAAEAAEQARLEKEAEYQRQAAEADAVIRRAEGEAAAYLLAQEAHAIEDLAGQLQQQASTIQASLSSLLAAVTGESVEFPLASVLEAFRAYQENHTLYLQAYPNLVQTLKRSKSAHGSADFSETENLLLVLPRPVTFRASFQLLAQWQDSKMSRDPLGRPIGTSAEVDAVCALVSAMLDHGRHGIKKFFRFK